MHKTVRNFMSLTSITEPNKSMDNTVWKMEEILRVAFRRDTLVTDADHIANLAKLTAVSESQADTYAPADKVKKVSSAFVRQVSICEVEQEQTHLCPTVDGRILQIDEEKRQALLGAKTSASGENEATKSE